MPAEIEAEAIRLVKALAQQSNEHVLETLLELISVEDLQCETRERLLQGLGRFLSDRSSDKPAYPVSAAWRGSWELLGEVWERLLEAHAREVNREGLVLTPPALARNLVEALDPSPEQSWLDPAAGMGAFLFAAREKGVPEDRLHGIELEAAQAILLAEALPQAKIVEADALAPLEELPPEWLGRFDRVVLNPPYRNGIEGRKAEWVRYREELSARFQTAKGSFDLYIPFVERALEMLRPGGLCGLLIPNRWLASRFGSELRSLLDRSCKLRSLDFGDAKRHFPRVDFHMMMMVIEKTGSGPFVGPGANWKDLDHGISSTITQSPDWLEDDKGWGPLLLPEKEWPKAAARTIGANHQVQASMSVAEFYEVAVVEAEACSQALPLISSGTLDPFRNDWGHRQQRIRGSKWIRPVVKLDSLRPVRIEQVGRHRVLLANLSKRLEAVSFRPGEGMGVVNVMQVFCETAAEADRLAAWLNTQLVNDWVSAWYGPLRMNKQLALNRSLVESFPAPPPATSPADPLLSFGECAKAHVHAGDFTALSALIAELDKWSMQEAAWIAGTP